MEPNLLLCDIGNTSIKFGIASESSILASYSFPVNNEETSDSLGLAFISAYKHSFDNNPSIRACVVSSVVPSIDSIMTNAINKYFGCPVYFAGQNLAIPLENAFPKPFEVGADILVGAYEARNLFPECAALIVIDFGTAVTFACVDGNAYKGGLVFPGPATAMTALALKTAKLPKVNLEYPGSEISPCVDTPTSIQHGLMFGYEALTHGLIAKLSEKLPKPIKIVATGGFAADINKFGSLFDFVTPTLVLDGLARLFKITFN